MPLLETKGAGSAQGFGLSLGGEEAVYIEDVFSTYLYTGTGASLPIVNGIDLDAEGGLVWTKSRSDSSFHKWYDSARGISFAIESNTTDANQTEVTGITSFNSNGYTYGTDGNTNSSGTNYASWTFRKQPKFFDIVTYTGNGVAGRTIAHDLGSVPGCIIVKGVSDAGQWGTYHRSLGASSSVYLNSTIASFSAGFWDNTTPTATHFSVASTFPNNSGQTYVAYLFAHDAGGFGLTGTDNVISCGTFTTDADGFATVNLGYEPQWVMVKKSDSTGNWIIFDNMRGWSNDQAQLNPNTSGAEGVGGPLQIIQSTGFATKAFSFSGNSSNIYIAIRRGPMKVPTSGTEVFKPTVLTNTASKTTTNFPVDLSIQSARNTDPGSLVVDRLRSTGGLVTFDANSENGYWGPITGAKFDDNTGVTVDFPVGASSYVNWSFRRAPGFFDEVCLNSTTSAAQVLSHNLGVAPELIISKGRNVTVPWQTMDATNYLRLNTDQADIGVPQYHTFTSTTFSINSGACSSGENWVFYLFATLAGVSKYGTYTGTGTTQVINCGFTAGSRFVMIKRTDSTGDWYYWDSARGIVAGNDPHLSLNTTAAEVTTDDSVDTDSTGFVVNQVAATNINVSSATYIFLAVA